MIFICYRREDSQADARNIWTVLDGKFAGDVFFDRKSISPGCKWPDTIRDALEKTSTVVVVIGRTWLTCQSQDGRRRLDNEEDWVRKEIQTALEKDKKIVPVLLDGISMPSKDDLPDVLKDLTDRQAISLTQGNWDEDVQHILEAAKIPLLPEPKIVLASESPRRIELLQQIGWKRDVEYYAISAAERIEYAEGSDIHGFVEATANEKIGRVVDKWRTLKDTQENLLNLNPAQTIIVGVDTIVVCEGRILNTPLKDLLRLASEPAKEEARKRAREMLRNQRGKSIEIITSVAVALASDKLDNDMPLARNTVTITTKAQLREYSDDDIESYVNTDEPLDKAGAFGIQERGVALFESISGSYSNIVGLPLREFLSLLRKKFGSSFAIPPLRSALGENTVQFQKHEFSALCVGDINYDFVYDKLPATFFSNLRAPGENILGEIRHGVGGTAVNFAKGLKNAGFSSCSVVGVVGDDFLGQKVISDLRDEKITPILEENSHRTTSIAIILRNKAKEDISISLTDANQALDPKVVDKTRNEIRQSDVFYCSGYSLTDLNRRDYAKEMMQNAIKSDCIAVLDVVVGMDEHISYQMLTDDIIGRCMYSESLGQKRVQVNGGFSPAYYIL